MATTSSKSRIAGVAEQSDGTLLVTVETVTVEQVVLAGKDWKEESSKPGKAKRKQKNDMLAAVRKALKGDKKP